MTIEQKNATKRLTAPIALSCISVGLFLLGNLLAVLGEFLFVAIPDGFFDAAFSIFNLIPIFNVLFTIPISVIGYICTLLPALLVNTGLCLAELVAVGVMVVGVILFAVKRSRFGTTASAILAVAMGVKILLDIGDFLVIYIVKPLLTVGGSFLILFLGNFAS